jgi:hypothetical protein
LQEQVANLCETHGSLAELAAKKVWGNRMGSNLYLFFGHLLQGRLMPNNLAQQRVIQNAFECQHSSPAAKEKANSVLGTVSRIGNWW